MSESIQDPFKYFEKQFHDTELPIMPADPLIEVLLSTKDPLDGAIKLQEYADTLPDEATEAVMRNGTNALRTKHYAEYSFKKILEVLITNGISYPDEKPEHRLRPDINAHLLIHEPSFIRGEFNNVMSAKGVSQETGHIRFIPAIIMQRPILLDSFSQPDENVRMPDYLMFPITSLLDNKYAFIDIDTDA